MESKDAPHLDLGATPFRTEGESSSSGPGKGNRNYIGWTALVFIFSLLLSQLFAHPKEKQSVSDRTTFDLKLKAAMQFQIPALHQAADPKPFNELLKEVSKTRATDPCSAEVYGLLLYEQHKKVPGDDLEGLSADPLEGPAVRQALSAQALEPEQATRLLSKIPDSSFMDRLLRADILAKAGKPEAHKQLFDHLAGTMEAMLIMEGSFVLLAGGAWITVIKLLIEGRLKPLGLPNLPESYQRADSIAIKTAGVFVIYAGLQLIPSILSTALGMSGNLLRIAAGVITVLLFPAIIRNGWGGFKTTLASLGLRRGSPWAMYICIGLLGFLLEFPVSAALASLGAQLLPKETFVHPAEVALANSRDPLLILALFLLAAVQAPLFEETIFRGFMLPAVTRVTGRLYWGIVITSVLFASIHPQGVGGWPGLFTIAAASCMLIYYSRSLAPSIVMHALHNGVTLAFLLFLS